MMSEDMHKKIATLSYNCTIIKNMSLNKIEPGIKLPVLEEISFTYQKIEWTWVDGGLQQPMIGVLLPKIYLYKKISDHSTA